jgi:hypothetical protein
MDAGSFALQDSYGLIGMPGFQNGEAFIREVVDEFHDDQGFVLSGHDYHMHLTVSQPAQVEYMASRAGGQKGQ